MADPKQDEVKDDTSQGESKSPTKPVVLKGDFARGKRTEPSSPEGPDFARGERTEPPSTEVGDFATGEHTLPKDDAAGSEKK